MIYIATTNHSKYKSLKRTLGFINNEIETKSIFRKKLGPPLETGKDESEDALIKAKYYSQKLEGDILCEDDRIYVHLQTKSRKIIKAISPKVNKKLSYLKRYLEKYKITKGILAKAIVGCNKKQCYIEKIGIPVKFVSVYNKVYNTNSNILNHFMVPEGFLSTFSEMREIDKQQFSEKYLVSPLEKVLKKLGYK